MPLWSYADDQILFTLQIRKHYSLDDRLDLQGETAVEDSPPLAPTKAKIYDVLSDDVYESI
jgi:hypothetical protein